MSQPKRGQCRRLEGKDQRTRRALAANRLAHRRKVPAKGRRHDRQLYIPGLGRADAARSGLFVSKTNGLKVERRVLNAQEAVAFKVEVKAQRSMACSRGSRVSMKTSASPCWSASVRRSVHTRRHSTPSAATSGVGEELVGGIEVLVALAQDGAAEGIKQLPQGRCKPALDDERRPLAVPRRAVSRCGGAGARWHGGGGGGGRVARPRTLVQVNNVANAVAIAKAGGIADAGVRLQPRRWAPSARDGLSNLALDDANAVEIAKAGGIKALVAVAHLPYSRGQGEGRRGGGGGAEGALGKTAQQGGDCPAGGIEALVAVAARRHGGRRRRAIGPPAAPSFFDAATQGTHPARGLLLDHDAVSPPAPTR